MSACPYCGSTGFVADETYSPDLREVDSDPDTYRWLNKCADPGCGKWSVWMPGERQLEIVDPFDPESLDRDS